MSSDRPQNKLKSTTIPNGGPTAVQEDSGIVPRRFRPENKIGLIEEWIRKSEKLASEEVAARTQDQGKLAEAAKLWVISAENRKDQGVEAFSAGNGEAETTQYLHAARDYLRAFECQSGLIASKTGAESESIASEMAKMMALATGCITLVSDRTKGDTNPAWRNEVVTKEVELRADMAARYFLLGNKNMQLERYQQAENCFSEARKNAEFGAIALRGMGDAESSMALLDKAMGHLEWKAHAAFLGRGQDAAEKEIRRAVRFRFEKVLKRAPLSEIEAEAHVRAISARIMKTIAAERATSGEGNEQLVNKAREGLAYAQTIFGLLGQKDLVERCQEAFFDLRESEIKANAYALAHETALKIAGIYYVDRGNAEPQKAAAIHLAEAYLRLIEYENGRICRILGTEKDSGSKRRESERARWKAEQFALNANKSLESAVKHCGEGDLEVVRATENVALAHIRRCDFDMALETLELKARVLEGTNADQNKITGLGQVWLAGYLLEEAEDHKRKNGTYARGVRFARPIADQEYEKLKLMMAAHPDGLKDIETQSGAVSELEAKIHEYEKYALGEKRAWAELLNSATEKLVLATSAFQSCREMKLAKEALAGSIEASEKTQKAFEALGELGRAAEQQRFRNGAESTLAAWNRD